MLVGYYPPLTIHPALQGCLPGIFTTMAGTSCPCEAIAGADMATRDSLLAKANAKNLPLGGR